MQCDVKLLVGASMPHTCEFNGRISLIYIYIICVYISYVQSINHSTLHRQGMFSTCTRKQKAEHTQNNTICHEKTDEGVL